MISIEYHSKLDQLCECCIHPLEKSFDQLGFSEWFGWSGIWDCTEAEVAVKGVGVVAAGCDCERRPRRSS